MSQTSDTQLPVGLLYMAGSALALSIMSLMVKLAGERLPTFELVMARSIIMLVIAAGHLRWIDQNPWGNNRPLLLARGLVGFSALSCFFYAVTHLPLADATLLHYLNPVFAAIIAALFLREPIEPAEALGIVASLAGVALIQQPGFLFGGSGRLALFPVLIALAGALLAATAYVLVRHLRTSEHPIVIIFYFSLVAAPASMVIGLPGALWPTTAEWLLLAGIGITAYASQVMMTRGLHLEKAGRATAVTYLQIAFAFGWDMLIFGQFPTPLSLAGALLIVGSALTIAWLRARR